MNRIDEQFNTWWNREGLLQADINDHFKPSDICLIRAIAKIAWQNGAYKQRVHTQAARDMVNSIFSDNT